MSARSWPRLITSGVIVMVTAGIVVFVGLSVAEGEPSPPYRTPSAEERRATTVPVDPTEELFTPWI